MQILSKTFIHSQRNNFITSVFFVYYASIILSTKMIQNLSCYFWNTKKSSTLVWCILKIWQIMKHFARPLDQA